uniref:Uncharacterized protein n=1 Tax=Lactuca sativa TaxID=4236 RepID=A0A9R1WF08_LACSA|nr:hypothetical protein LSAT_V11C200088460 [Lactuca sativa]
MMKRRRRVTMKMELKNHRRTMMKMELRMMKREFMILKLGLEVKSGLEQENLLKGSVTPRIQKTKKGKENPMSRSQLVESKEELDDQSGSIVDMKIIILDDFKEELDESKAISLIYEGGLGEFKEGLNKSDEGGSRCIEGALDEFTKNSMSRIEVLSFLWTVGLNELVVIVRGAEGSAVQELPDSSQKCSTSLQQCNREGPGDRRGLRGTDLYTKRGRCQVGPDVGQGPMQQAWV